MNLIYRSTIDGYGQLAPAALEDGMLILFGDHAPDSIAEYCYLQPLAPLSDGLTPGAVCQLGGKRWPVTAVGSEAANNLRHLGHVTLHFDGASTPLAPGCIHLRGVTPAAVAIGSEFCFFTSHQEVQYD